VPNRNIHIEEPDDMSLKIIIVLIGVIVSIIGGWVGLVTAEVKQNDKEIQVLQNEISRRGSIIESATTNSQRNTETVIELDKKVTVLGAKVDNLDKKIEDNNKLLDKIYQEVSR
jgi:septal ring factor EnvC (AmiA/AmiB activator)